MSNVLFCSPDGEDMANPDSDRIHELYFLWGDEFWASGSGDSGIYFDDGKEQTSLLLIKRDNFGVHIRFACDFSPDLILAGKSLGKTIRITVGGEPATFPDSFFVPIEVGWTAIQTFLKTGKADPKLDWVAD